RITSSKTQPRGSICSGCRLPITAEEAILLPLRAVGLAGYLHHQRANDLFELGGSAQVHGLGQVGGRGVVTVRPPALENLSVRRALLKTNLHGQRGDSVENEIVLVAADEGITLRLGVDLGFDA